MNDTNRELHIHTYGLTTTAIYFSHVAKVVFTLKETEPGCISWPIV